MKQRAYLLLIFITITIYDTYSQSEPITSREVQNYVGSIHMFPSFFQHKYYFKKTDGQIFGIGYLDPTEEERIKFEQVIYNNWLISVNGTLFEGTLAPNGKNISIKSLNIIKERITEFKNFTYIFDEIKSSSYLVENISGYKNDIHYMPYHTIDQRLDTCWVEGTEGSGIGEWIKLTSKSKILLKKIGISIGFDKNDNLFYDNNRVKKIKITLNSGDFCMEYSLKDQRGIQYITFDPSIDINTITFEVMEVYPGQKYNDTCISEIEVWGQYQ